MGRLLSIGYRGELIIEREIYRGGANPRYTQDSGQSGVMDGRIKGKMGMTAAESM